MYITNNFTLEELFKSNTADKLKIDNTPNKDATNNLMILVLKILQPLRDAYGKPITVNSGYRCTALNKAVKGSSTSQHLKGEAADIVGYDNKKLFDTAKKLIDEGKITVGQLIDEYDYRWVHISSPTSKHKNQILHLK